MSYELKTQLKRQGVSDARIITIKKNGDTIKLNTAVLTFNFPKPSAENKVGFELCPIQLYIPHLLKDYAKARRTISEAKRQSWRAYASTLNNNTSAKHTWQMLRRISGKRKDKTIKYLVTDSDTLTNKTDIAETLATSFAAKSSPDHYQEKFRKIRDKEKENTLDFESDNDEKYNVNFSKRELIKSIAQATDSATGPDEINKVSTKMSHWHTLKSTRMTTSIKQRSCLIANTIYCLLILILFMVASSFLIISAVFIVILKSNLYFFHKNIFLVLLIY